MNIFDDGFNQAMALIGHRSPLCHQLAAGRLRMLCRLAKTKEQRGRLVQAARVWTESLETLLRTALEVSKKAKPLVKKIEESFPEHQKQEPHESSATPPALTSAQDLRCNDCKTNDGFLDDVPIDVPPKTPKQRVRPSRVIQPGPLGPVLDRLRSGSLDSEDELRTWCIFGEEMLKDGCIPRVPLVDHPTVIASNHAIVQTYRERRIERSWATSKDWDTSLVEDMTLLITLTKGESSTDDIDFRAQFLLPYMRRWNAIQMGFAFRDAHARFRAAKIIARCKPHKYELTCGWDEKLRPTLLAAWEAIRDPEVGGGSRRPVGGPP